MLYKALQDNFGTFFNCFRSILGRSSLQHTGSRVEGWERQSEIKSTNMGSDRTEEVNTIERTLACNPGFSPCWKCETRT